MELLSVSTRDGVGDKREIESMICSAFIESGDLRDPSPMAVWLTVVSTANKQDNTLIRDACNLSRGAVGE